MTARARVAPERRAALLGQTAGRDAIACARPERPRAIGSCGFCEPLAELEALGILRP